MLQVSCDGLQGLVLLLQVQPGLVVPSTQLTLQPVLAQNTYYFLVKVEYYEQT